MTLHTTHLIMIITMVISLTGIIGLDIYMAVNRVIGDTFSELTGTALHNSLLLQLGLGVLMGHLVWHITQDSFKLPGIQTMLALSFLGMIALGLDIQYWLKPNLFNNLTLVRHYPIIIFILGFIGGRFIWPQRLM